MLTGTKLGAAVAEAIRLKGVSKAAVARHFGIKGPSIYDWIDHGRVGKQHLTELVAYFADVVPPSHWGLSIPSDLPSSQESQLLRLDAEIVRHAINVAKKSFRLAHDEELVIERDPELFAQALRAAFATRQRMESENAGSGPRDGQASAAGGAESEQEDGQKAAPMRSRARKSA